MKSPPFPLHRDFFFLPPHHQCRRFRFHTHLSLPFHFHFVFLLLLALTFPSVSSSSPVTNRYLNSVDGSDLQNNTCFSRAHPCRTLSYIFSPDSGAIGPLIPPGTSEAIIVTSSSVSVVGVRVGPVELGYNSFLEFVGEGRERSARSVGGGSGSGADNGKRVEFIFGEGGGFGVSGSGSVRLEGFEFVENWNRASSDVQECEYFLDLGPADSVVKDVDIVNLDLWHCHHENKKSFAFRAAIWEGVRIFGVSNWTSQWSALIHAQTLESVEIWNVSSSDVEGNFVDAANRTSMRIEMKKVVISVSEIVFTQEEQHKGNVPLTVLIGQESTLTDVAFRVTHGVRLEVDSSVVQGSFQAEVLSGSDLFFRNSVFDWVVAAPSDTVLFVKDASTVHLRDCQVKSMSASAFIRLKEHSTAILERLDFSKPKRMNVLIDEKNSQFQLIASTFEDLETVPMFFRCEVTPGQEFDNSIDSDCLFKPELGDIECELGCTINLGFCDIFEKFHQLNDWEWIIAVVVIVGICLCWYVFVFFGFVPVMIRRWCFVTREYPKGYHLVLDEFTPVS